MKGMSYGRGNSISLFVKFLILLAALLISLVLSVRFGSVEVDTAEILSEVGTMISQGHMGNSPSSMILWQIRIPRTLFSMLCGVGLALSGLLLQTITRNDLADPYVLGVSSGASTGAVMAIIWGWFSFAGGASVAAGAFIGAACSTAIVIAASGRSNNPIRLVLVGMGVSAFFSALTMMVIYGARHEAQVRSAMFWLVGSLSGMQWGDLQLTACGVLIMFVLVFLVRNDLDLMLLGSGEAENLGLNLKHFQLFVILLTSAMVALLVSKSGIIGFVGLITPHMARAVAGPSHGKLMVFSSLIGGLVMIWSDVFSRALFAPEELPIGVLTACVGAPVFLWIVTHRYGEGN